MGKAGHFQLKTGGRSGLVNLEKNSKEVAVEKGSFPKKKKGHISLSH